MKTLGRSNQPESGRKWVLQTEPFEAGIKVPSPGSQDIYLQRAERLGARAAAGMKRAFFGVVRAKCSDELAASDARDAAHAAFLAIPELRG